MRRLSFHLVEKHATLLKKGSGVKMRPSGIGGMAVMEGVMMKNKEEYAVAVRKPNNEIVVEKNIHKDFSDKIKLFKLPILRGILAFIDSMVVGVKVLNFSASFFEEEEDNQSKKKKSKQDSKQVSVDADFEIEEVSDNHKDAVKAASEEVSSKDKVAKKEENTTLMMVLAVMLSIVLSVALFMVLPVLLMQLLSKVISSTFALNLIEGLVRLAIFIGYVLLATLMPEIKRTFMYHGAEHKTINCLEHGCELTVANVKKHSKQHKRCGTSFMLLVILISLVLFILLPTGNLIWKILSRVLLVPIIAGVSYEFIRLAGKSESKIVDILSKPGLWMQGLTTKEPDDSMIEVAIESVGAVFDWKAFLEESKQDSKKSKKTERTKQAEDKSGSDKLTVAENKKPAKQPKKEEETVNKPQQKETAAKQSQTKAAVPYKDKIAPPHKPSDSEDEDDEILKALDKFFDEGGNERTASGK